MPDFPHLPVERRHARAENYWMQRSGYVAATRLPELPTSSFARWVSALALVVANGCSDGASKPWVSDAVRVRAHAGVAFGAGGTNRADGGALGGAIVPGCPDGGAAFATNPVEYGSCELARAEASAGI